MKICITATGTTLSAELDPRFGRAQNYLIYDTDTKTLTSLANENIEAAGGAGTAAAQLMSKAEVSAVISGNFGPNASTGLNALQIAMYTSPVMPIGEVLDKFAAGQLIKVTSATVAGKH
jgi:predicted Fe-Mo cluster-binding NifX family protein